MATFDTQINSWVNAVQFHDASAAQLALYNSQLSAGTSNQTVQFNIISEGATLAYVNPVVRMYQAAFGRIPDLAGEKSWVNQLQTGANTIPSMGNWFASAPEFANLYNGANAQTPANKVLVDSFYFNVLQRAPDAQGEAFWISSGLKAGQLLSAFSESAEFIGTSTPQAQGLQQLNIQGQYPTNVFVSLFATPSYQQVISGNVGYTLTPNADTATANQFNGNAIFVPAAGATVQTITNGDNLTGSGTNATLRGQLIGTNATITTNNVATYTLQTTAATVLNGSITGLTTFNNNSSTAAVTINNLNTVLTNLNLSAILGGALTTTTLGFNSAAAFSATSSLAIGVSGGSSSGAVTINAGGATGYSTLAVSSTGGATNTIATLTALNNAGAATDTTLTIAGDTALRLNQVDGSLTTINAGALTAGGTAFTGNLTIGNSAVAQIAMAGTTASSNTITGGNGVNTFVISNLSNTYKITGGTGTTDKVVVVGTGGVASSPTTSAIEIIELGGAYAVNGNNYGAGWGAAAGVVNLGSTAGVTALQLDGGAAGANTGIITVTGLALTNNALTINDIGTGGAAAQSFNGLNLAVTGTTPTLTWNINNQGTSFGGANGITTAASTLTGFTTINLNVADVSSTNVVTLGAVSDVNLATFKAVSAGGLALGAQTWGALTALDLSGVAGVETGTVTSTQATVTEALGASTNAASVVTLTDTALKTFTLSSLGTKAIINGSTVTTGQTVNAGSDNFAVSYSTAAGSGAAVVDTMTFGNGNNYVADNSAGVINIVSGTGFSTFALTGQVGTGANGNTVIDTITVGTHTSTAAGVSQNVGLTNAATLDNFGVGNIAAGAAIIGAASTGGYSVITGAAVNDLITFGTGAGNTTVTVRVANSDADVKAFATWLNGAAPAAATYVEQIGGSTYVIEHTAAGALAAADSVVGVTGLHTFSATAAGVLTVLT